MMAEKIGMDPFEFRWRNIAREGETAIASYPYRAYPLEEIMTKMRPYYEEALSRARAEDTPELRRGVGLSWGGYCSSINQFDEATIRSCSIPTQRHKYDTWQDLGQGRRHRLPYGHAGIPETLGTPSGGRASRAERQQICPNSGPRLQPQPLYEQQRHEEGGRPDAGRMKKPDGSFRS
jgi:aldehyde oxidoreductase